MISIICAVNNTEILEKMLISSLKKQTYQNFEFISVDAKSLGFKSASDTLNYGASQANGEILLFVHQDVELIDHTILQSIVNFDREYEYGIAGVCGIVGTGEYKNYSSVLVGYNKKQTGIKNTQIREIYALDECLFFLNRSNFMGFDDLGDTWHFYAVDYSYRCHKKEMNVMLIPNPIYHLSPGWSLDYSYFDTLNFIGKKYNKEKYIKTCMGVFNNRKTLKMYCEYRKLKIFIKKKLGIDRKNG